MENDPAWIRMVGGRKFILTVGGCLLVALLSLWAPRPPDAEIQAIAAMILVFNGANAAVSWGSMKMQTDTTTTSTNVNVEQVQARRQLGADDQVEPTNG